MEKPYVPMAGSIEARGRFRLWPSAVTTTDGKPIGRTLTSYSQFKGHPSYQKIQVIKKEPIKKSIETDKIIKTENVLEVISLEDFSKLSAKIGKISRKRSKK